MYKALKGKTLGRDGASGQDGAKGNFSALGRKEPEKFRFFPDVYVSGLARQF